jgi:tellurite resistance protein TehA-like permease
MAIETLLYSHILPPIAGFIGVILICSGIMDDNRNYTIMGVVCFLAAGLLPFIILPFVLGA